MEWTYVDEAVDAAEEPDGFAEGRVPAFEGGFGFEPPAGVGGVAFFDDLGGFRGCGLGDGVLAAGEGNRAAGFGAGEGDLTVAGWVVEFFFFGLVAFDFVAEDGLGAEDEAGLAVFEGGLDEVGEVDLVGVVGLGFFVGVVHVARL